MGKTRDLFKKIRDTKGTFHAKRGTIKDRNGMDLTEAEDKKRWQEYWDDGFSISKDASMATTAQHMMHSKAYQLLSHLPGVTRYFPSHCIDQRKISGCAITELEGGPRNPNKASMW